MPDMRAAIQEKLPLTVSEMVAVAQEYGVRVVDVVLVETELRTGKSREEILTGIMEEYAHNLKAVEIGVKDGESILLGTVASQLAAQEGSKCFEDSFLDDALLYTLSISPTPSTPRWATTAWACAPAPGRATPAPTPALSRP